MRRSMRARAAFTAVAASASAAWVACAPAPHAPHAPSHGAGDAVATPRQTAWIASGKLDLDTQEFVLRAYDEPLRFPFEVRLSGPLDRALDGERPATSPEDPSRAVVRRAPAGLGAVVTDDRVRAVRCAAPSFAPVDARAWRAKVDPDVRLVHAAGGACWTAVTLHFARDASDDDRERLERLGVVIHGFDARTAIAYAPIRGVPNVAALDLVAAIEPRAGAPEPL